MTISAQLVNEILRDCLFNQDEPMDGMVRAEGIVRTFGFHPGRLEMHKEEIGQMLAELPDVFKVSGGGGMSFLNACQTRDGELWTGLQQTVDELVVLGIATGQATYLPEQRELWSAFPGGVPYVQVKA